MYPFLDFSQQCGHGVVSFPPTAVRTWGCIPFRRTQCRYAGCISFHLQHCKRAVCIYQQHLQCGHAGCISLHHQHCRCAGRILHITCSVDVQDVSLSTACFMDGRVYPTYTISGVDVLGLSLYFVNNKDVQGVSLFTFEQCFKCPECWTVRHPVSPVPEWIKMLMSGVVIKGPSPVPECTSTGLRCWMPECRWNWTQLWCRAMAVSTFTLQTRLDLYNSEIALASSPVLFWNLCVHLEIWISIVICRLAAVVGQAINAPPPPPPFSFSSLFLRDSCQLRKSSISTSLTPFPPYP